MSACVRASTGAFAARAEYAAGTTTDDLRRLKGKETFNSGAERTVVRFEPAIIAPVKGSAADRCASASCNVTGSLFVFFADKRSFQRRGKKKVFH